MWRPQPWQNANPTGVGVPQRGHGIVAFELRGAGAPTPWFVGTAPSDGGAAFAGCSVGPVCSVFGPTPGYAIGCACMGGGVMSGGGATGMGGGVIIGICGCIGGGAISAEPHPRQNFMPGGFSLRHIWQMTGNPA